ncbi:hypothetical protein BC936DRAFT_139855 [Jimgerdemannia flammicorona]|uniref:Protein kinase domain-containing protein n=1 Tax=Jimgerdemannia flammicorona TaxID=994334 RepID=A0A433DHF7_9FUNG|nr:hypothetical protein BC936DRAFT_139855 [Jimgerdemannia flammicorona]
MNEFYAYKVTALTSPQSIVQTSIIHKEEDKVRPGIPARESFCDGTTFSEDEQKVTSSKTAMELYNARQLATAILNQGCQARIQANKNNFPGNEQQLKAFLNDAKISDELAMYLTWIPFERFDSINVVSSGEHWTFLRGTISSETPWGFACPRHNDMPESWKETNRRCGDIHYDFNEQRKYTMMACNKRDAEMFKKQVIFSTLLSAFNNAYDTMAPIGFTRRNEQELPYIVLDFTEVGNFARQIEHNKGRSWSDVWRYAVFLASGLRDFHSLGAIHGNLHPGALAVAGEKCLPYLVNFGLGHHIDQEPMSSAEFPASNCFSANYLPPEFFISKQPSQASDVYCLGALLWQLVTTVPPRGSVKTIQRTDGLRDDLIPGVPKAYENICHSCWKVNPQERPEAQQVVDQLLAAEIEIRVAKCMSPQTMPFVTERRADARISGMPKDVIQTADVIETDEELFSRLRTMSKEEFGTLASNDQPQAQRYMRYLAKRQAEIDEETKELDKLERQMLLLTRKTYPWKWLRRALRCGEYAKNYPRTPAQAEAFLNEWPTNPVSEDRMELERRELPTPSEPENEPELERRDFPTPSKKPQKPNWHKPGKLDSTKASMAKRTKYFVYHDFWPRNKTNAPVVKFFSRKRKS